MGTLRIRKVSRNTFALSGTVMILKTLGDDVKLEVIIMHGRKTRVYAPPKESICKFIAEEKRIYPGLVEVSNFPEPGTCPILKNNYTITNYIVRTENLPKIVPLGTYFIDILATIDGSSIAGYTLEAVIVT